MVGDGKKLRPEREQTNQSLRTERENTDAALAEKQGAAAQEAEMVLERARAEADAVLSEARDRADERLDGIQAPDATRATVAEERSLEDLALREERAAADENLLHEREESDRALLRLRPLERDATDRFLLTERLRSDDAVSNRDSFLGIVSHDLRNLLGAVVLSAGLVSDRATGEAEGADLRLEMARIQRYAARMNRLIGDLLDVASIDAGKLAVRRARHDMSTVIHEAVDTFRESAASSGIALEAHLPGPLMADADHDRMFQVLANLITNAIKSTPRGGKITIRGERRGAELRFSVEDTGCGFPAEMRDAIFERFWQVGKNDRRGLGLGLFISKSIVEAHGGRIWADSEPGVGSTFWLTLPAPLPG